MQKNKDALLRDVASELGRAKGKHGLYANTSSRKLSLFAKKVEQRAHHA